jgi:hypothetical protein
LEYDQAGTSPEFEPPTSNSDPALRQDDDWQLLSGTVELYYRTSSRLLAFRIPNGGDRIFRLRLAAKPDPEQGWSEWRASRFPRRAQPASN